MHDDNKNVVAILEQEIAFHSDAYTAGQPQITDAEFDAKVDHLRSLRPESPVLKLVGGASYGKKVQHVRPMGSLDKATVVADLITWFYKYSRNSEYAVITPKVDGLSVRLEYEEGNLTLAATRGDGHEGQDVTDNVRASKIVPLKIGTFTGEVRGEVYMKRSVFAKLIAAGEDFANPRNAAVGSLCAKDPALTAARQLSFLAYDWSIDFAAEDDKLDYMRKVLVGIDVIEWGVCQRKDIQATILQWESRRAKLDYQIDGLVIALSSPQDQSDAGFNGLRPRGKIAYKFAPSQEKARVLAIDCQVGRTGKITPMCRIEPTLVDGSTIENITLHNTKRYHELNVSPGDTVLIEKAGDIIPQVVSVVRAYGQPVTLNSPQRVCPACGAQLEYDGVNSWCKNTFFCPAQLLARLLHWVTVTGMDEIGEGTLVKLIEARLISDPEGLYSLMERQIASAIGSDVNAAKVYAAIQKTKRMPLAIFLEALGIDGLGAGTAKDLANRYKRIDLILYKVDREETDFDTIPGIGKLTALKIYTGFTELRPMITRLVTYFIQVQDVIEVQGKLKGQSFVVTGTLSKPRKEIEKMITSNGGEVKSSVNKTLTGLIVGDDPGSKVDQAKKYGIRLWTEADLMSVIV